MGKNKLRKFAEMETNPLVLQYPFRTLKNEGFPLKGRWNEFFKNDNPIVLELGCGKGEYTVGLAQRFPDKNFIGIDIKGARMHSGATKALNSSMTNVAFLRTSIELLDGFFALSEVDEIWITFPDPQMKKVNKRLTGTRFIDLYRRVLKPSGVIHLKSDSPFLYTYTSMMVEYNKLEIIENIPDVHSTISEDSILAIRTHYESQWLERGLTIKYLAFRPGTDSALSEPPMADEIPQDTYRSYSRGYIQQPDLMAERDSQTNEIS